MVCDLEDAITPYSSRSRESGVGLPLRLAGLVTVRGEGRRRIYQARNNHVRLLIREALYHADHHVSGHDDHA